MHHLGTGGDRTQNEVAQFVRIPDRHLHEEVIGAGHVKHRNGLVQGEHGLPERHHRRVGLPCQTHSDQRLKAHPQRPGVDLRVEPSNHASGHQSLHTLVTARFGEPYTRCQLLIGQPCILLQGHQNGAIDSVERFRFEQGTNFLRILTVHTTFILTSSHPTEHRPPSELYGGTVIRSLLPDFDTLAVHAGRADFHALGVHAPPIDLSSTYPVPDPEQGTASYDAMAAGGTPQGSAIYARLHNPTVARAEQAVAELEGAEACVAFASGMAATTAILLAAAMHGRHVVAVRPLYGGTDHLLDSGLLPIDVTFAEPHEVAQAIRPDTGLVFIETPANPTLDLLDISAIVRDAGTVPVVVDSTFATPVLQQPLRHGATMVLHSATKFLGGHGDVVAGVVATSEVWARRLRQVRILTGGILHPLAAFLLLRGLPTLPMRVEHAQRTAGVLMERLAAHPMITGVHYPGHAGSDPTGLIGRQMAGPGTLIAFEVRGGVDAANALMRALTLITPAVSLGSTDTLIQHPAGLTHRLLDPAVREAEGITDGLLRLSVGLESAEALWRDLAAGLDAAEDVAEHTEGTLAMSSR